jgi:predicted Ser/Thr protein kinase
LSDIPPPEALTAALAGRYDFQRELGRGGMATVYLAADRKHHRQVAIKVLRPDLAATLGAARFLKEIEIAARLTHPHILALHDSGEAGGYLYYVMPYIEGGSLRQVLEKERRLEVERAFGIAGFVADALGYAHRMGVLHRDIKPENILFSQGHPVVADFGIAKAISTAGGANLTRTGFPLGTPGYMSPEQAAGLTDLDERTDVYSLGVVVYEMLVGETPGRWPSEESVRTGRLLEALPSHRLQLARLPDRVEGALARAFAIRGEQRTASPAALIADLRGDAGAAGVSRGAAVEAAGAVAGPPAAAAPHRRYNENEVEELVRRAAELDATHATAGGAMTIGGVQRLAEEALIPPERVREAARAMEARRAEPVPVLADGTPDTQGQRVARFWLGAPTYLLFERVVTGEVPDVEFPALVEVMRAEMGQLGQGSQLGRSFSWATTRSGAGGGRDVQVLVSVRGGTTRVQVRENLGQLAGGIMGGFGGGLGGGGLGPLLGVLAGGLHSPVAAFVAVPFWLGAVYAGARSMFFYSVRRRRAQLARLTEQLAELAAQVVPARLR